MVVNILRFGLFLLFSWPRACLALTLPELLTEAFCCVVLDIVLLLAIALLSFPHECYATLAS
jgi:hypothetical protein